MRLVDHFNTFLDDVVNLNTTRVGQLESSIEAVKNVVQASGLTFRRSKVQYPRNYPVARSGV